MSGAPRGYSGRARPTTPGDGGSGGGRSPSPPSPAVSEGRSCPGDAAGSGGGASAAGSAHADTPPVYRAGGAGGTKRAPRMGFWDCLKETWHIFLLVTIFKLLLGMGPSTYRSTDFEVHRNWLAITHSLPLKQWYYEATSQWTLDYPPFFAWFEWALSQAAVFFDPAMLDVSNLGHSSRGTIVFQRLSVVVADAVFYFGILLYCSSWSKTTTVEVRSSHAKVCIVTMLALCSPGLFFVDHIHFQYNGFLLGILLVSVALVRMERDLAAGAMFAVLLMFKHIFAYAAPLYFVYLLRHYCFEPVKAPSTGYRSRVGSYPEQDALKSLMSRRFRFGNLLKMAIVVIMVVAVAFGPFIYTDPAGDFKQIMSRLFPWGRGLTHAYWAPNTWALYNGADKVAVTGAKIFSAVFKVELPSAISNSSVGGFTGGLVGNEALHVILPSVKPFVTAALTLITMLPVLLDVWRMPHPQVFCPALVYCMLCSFMMGWHVHEKAILMALVPMSMIACDGGADGRLYFFLSSVAHVSLFPLLYEAAEGPILVLITVTYSILSFVLLDYFHRLQQVERRISPIGVSANFFSIGLTDLLGSSSSGDDPAPTKSARARTRVNTDSDTGFDTPLLRQGLDLGRAPGVRALVVERCYIAGLVLLHFYSQFVHQVVFGSRLPFLPLMMYSVYCSVGVAYCWFRCLEQHRARLCRIRTYLDDR